MGSGFPTPSDLNLTTQLRQICKKAGSGLCVKSLVYQRL